MTKKCFLPLLLGSAALFFLSNCASITGFQDGRTVGKDNGDFYGSLNFSTSPNFGDWRDDSVSVDLSTLAFFSLEFGGRYGVAEKVDLTLRLNTNLNMGMGTKFQLVGDRSSPFALALGAEVGSFGIALGLLNVQIPLYVSVHPSENFGWYFTPRYIRQFSTFAGVQNRLTYLGANTGLLFGKRNKFGIDLGYYRLGGIEESIPVIHLGVGGRFAFGKN